MDFGLLPPEINSGRMYTGPGAAPMLGAATAWGALAVELRSTAVAYSSVISELTAQWRGPSSAKMARAAASYSAWVDVTAANAEHTAEQATAAAGAFDTAYAATVPPPIVAANRAQLAFLVATNVLGQNAPAIAATDIQYAEMWAQDATAMYNYDACSAAASQMTAFASPPRGTTAPAASAADPPTDPISVIGTILGPTSPLSLLSPGIGGYLIGTEPYGLASVGSSVANLHQKVLALPSTPGGEVLQGDVGSNARLVGSSATVSAELGRAGAVARLSVPQSWAAAAPEMRLSAAAGSAIGLVNPPTAIATDIPGNFYGNLALQGAATRAAADPDGVGRSARGRGRVQPWQNTTTIIVVPDDE